MLGVMRNKSVQNWKPEEEEERKQTEEKERRKGLEQPSKKQYDRASVIYFILLVSYGSY